MVHARRRNRKNSKTKKNVYYYYYNYCYFENIVISMIYNNYVQFEALQKGFRSKMNEL